MNYRRRKFPSWRCRTCSTPRPATAAQLATGAGPWREPSWSPRPALRTGRGRWSSGTPSAAKSSDLTKQTFFLNLPPRNSYPRPPKPVLLHYPHLPHMLRPLLACTFEHQLLVSTLATATVTVTSNQNQSLYIKWSSGPSAWQTSSGNKADETNFYSTIALAIIRFDQAFQR